MLDTRQVQPILERWLNPAPGEPLEETLLVRDGHLWGRRFRHGELCAVWDFEQNQLQLMDLDGQVLNTAQPTPPQTRAA